MAKLKKSEAPQTPWRHFMCGQSCFGKWGLKNGHFSSKRGPSHLSNAKLSVCLPDYYQLLYIYTVICLFSQYIKSEVIITSCVVIQNNDAYKMNPVASNQDCDGPTGPPPPPTPTLRHIHELR